MKQVVAVVTLTILTILFDGCFGKSPWTWRCNQDKEVIGGHSLQGRCVKELWKGEDEEVASNGRYKQIGMMACKMTCNTYGMLWPQPTGQVELSEELIHLLPGDINIAVAPATANQEPLSDKVNTMIGELRGIFREYLYMMHPKYQRGSGNNPFPSAKSANASIRVVLSIKGNSSRYSERLTMDTDESFRLSIANERVEIEGETYFGCRHGLETLSQLISYDELTESLQMHSSGLVEDAPAYIHRGLLIDTSRNYFNLDILKGIVDGLSYNKMNVFHWHITDTHSFPLHLKSVPELAQYGAYSPEKTYSAEDVGHLVNYARVRGVKVIPEFDAPAHVGNGWQFAEKNHPEWGKLAVCVNQEEWQDFCVEPPCGQLNIVNEKMYEVLSNIYQEYLQLFDTDVFHMGGDEVNMNCYNTSAEIRRHLELHSKQGTEDDILDLWRTFQRKAFRLVAQANDGERMPAILWTNTMTERGVEKFLPKDDYIIQIWTTGTDESINDVISKGYKTIFSNYDAWYLDCGYAGWVTDGQNWCSPYKGWQRVYDNSPRQIYRSFNNSEPSLEANILGGEACMWSEQVGGEAIHGKLWPRGAALAERLWSDLPTDWKEAEYRMVHHRERMVSRGIAADAIQPEWCHQNEGLCYLRKPSEKKEKPDDAEDAEAEEAT